jgi:chemotaxis signal transduction protein
LQPPPEVVFARVASHFVKGVVHRENGIVLLLDINDIVNLRTGAAPAGARTHSASAHATRTREF